MGGGEAGADGAIARQHTDVIRHVGVLAGPEPEYQRFHQMAAAKVADDGRHDEGKGPQTTLFTKIEGNKDQQEQIERHPKFRLPQKRENIVQKRVRPFLVDPDKKPAISL